MIKNLGLLIVFLLFSACSNVKKQDIDSKTMSLSVKQTKSSYRVRGKKYVVMKTSKNYREQGIASWYGLSFHKRRTTSGERFNMFKLTAAHKTLPLSSYVEVTNLLNGKKIKVKVNDRGPFEEDRLIDLSYLAAKKLGMLGRGTAPVSVEAIDLEHIKEIN